MTAYYNEINPYCVEWLKNLMHEGLIAKGDVDDRPIQEVSGGDVRGYTQCHWFAGTGRWSVALREAGWGDSREVWTGSCPCQGFSVSGKRLAFDDPRHLWPEWKRLISECEIATIFGEQVTGYPAWLDLVRGDLEAMDYAVGAMPIEAASAGADHFRDRYWFVGHDTRRQRDDGKPSTRSRQTRKGGGSNGGNSVRHGTLANSHSVRPQVEVGQSRYAGAQRTASSGSDIRPMVNDSEFGWGQRWSESEFRRRGFTATVANIRNRQYVECPDGKWRRLPPSGVRWLGNGLPARIPCLQAIGNSIDTRPAAAFISAFMESDNG